MAIDYEKLAEESSDLVYWERYLSEVKRNKAQAEANIAIAEREISIRKIKMADLIREGGNADD